MSQKTALITGAGRAEGLGVATARALAERGFHVIVSARTEEQAERQAAALRAEGHSASGLRVDLADPEDFARVAERIAADHGRLDALVNNASVFPDMETGSALDASVDDIRSAFAVNVVGPWALTIALRGLLEAAPAGRIVNISSGAYQQITYLPQHPGDVGAPAYSFAKHTLNQLGVMLAAAFRDTDVLVTTVDPGRADTHPELGTDEEDAPPSVAAAWIADAATLPAGAPSGAVLLEGRRVG